MSTSIQDQLPPPLLEADWRPVKDDRIVHIWGEESKPRAYVSPTFYQENGTPIYSHGYREGDDMQYLGTFVMAAAARDIVRLTKVDDLPLGNVNNVECPTCNHPLIEVNDLTYGELKKISSWTVAQLTSFMDLVKWGKVDFHELLENTSGGVMPGIGGALVGDVGTIGVSRADGIFIGIEPDGYTHS